MSLARRRDYALAMALMPNLNPRLVDALFAETMALADQARACFEEARAVQGRAGDDLQRVQISCEALRTTTRIMHCLAWLLNHRAFFAGELSELQLRRHGRLISGFPGSDPAVEPLLPDTARVIVRESERIYDRIQRLERAWRGETTASPGAVARLKERLRAVPGPAV